MCGIVAYSGKKNAIEHIIYGLKKLEYRGYDSAGVAFFDQQGVQTVKKKGRVSVVAQLCSGRVSHCAIGHTRWATHGAPDDANAHPHTYCGISVVHNGIIENYAELRREAESEGEEFCSQTDSEVIAHLIHRHYRGDLLDALYRTADRIEGSYAIVAMCDKNPDTLVALCHSAPLLVARDRSGSFVASDIIALPNTIKQVHYLSEDSFALLSRSKLTFFDADLHPIKSQATDIDCTHYDSALAGHTTYMHKEIYEIPRAVSHTLSACANICTPTLSALLKKTDRVIITACGTAYHSALVAKIAIERLTRIPVEVEVASEFHYKDPILTKNTLLIAVSQSGETADTLSAVRLVKAHNIPVIAITNVENSTLARLCDHCLHTKAGVEIGVAATKSYNAQLCTLYHLALCLARCRRDHTCATCTTQHHDCTTQHHDYTPQSHTYTPQHHNCTPQHRPCHTCATCTPQHHNCTQQSHTCTSQSHTCTPQHHDCTPQSHDCATRHPQHHDCTTQHRPCHTCATCTPQSHDCATRHPQHQPCDTQHQPCGTHNYQDFDKLHDLLSAIPRLTTKVLECDSVVKGIADRFCHSKSIFFIGRGADYAVALEGSLKLKEISYIHSEGYPAGELKHGTIALIEKGTPVVVIMTQQDLLSKTLNAVAEVKARGAVVIAVTCFEVGEAVDYTITIPRTDSLLTPLLAVIPLQLFAYHSSLALSRDPDKPRNLAKSVTVE